MSILNETQYLLLQLNFTNCTELVYLWKSFNRADPYDRSINTTLTYQYPLNGLQDYLKTYHLAQPNMTEIAAWRETKHVEGHVTMDAEYYCKSEVCPLLGWEGNLDVVGLGVSFSDPLHTVR
jgi:hypothetical protein